MLYKRKDFKVASPVDGAQLEGTILLPQTPKGIVQIFHGMAEHKERYLHFMEFLASHGYAAVIHNHRGHGTCELKGHFGGQHGESLILDGRAVQEWAKQELPDLPVYLFGHSMGSLVARCYLKRFDEDLAGLFLCGVPFAPNIAIKTALTYIALKRKLHGDRYTSSTVNAMVVGAFNRGIKKPCSPNQWISYEQANVEKYDADPLCGFCFTLDGFRGLMELMQEAYSGEGWALKNPRLRVHFISGADDPCHTGEARFFQAVAGVEKQGYPVTFKLYPGMRHEILNETEKETVYQDVLAKLEEL